MMPKSIEPSEMRLADCPIITIIVKVNSSDMGMVNATMSDARK
jgi:hypothetical protein